MIEIIPAIIPTDYSDLKEKLSRVLGAVTLVQIDVCDGKFTPSRSWPYIKEDKYFEAMLAEEDGLPFWDRLDFEIDMMVVDPETKFDDWVRAGAKRLIVHYESVPDFGKTVEYFKENFGSLKDTPFSVEMGIAVGIDTPNEKIYPYLADVGLVQFMGIEKIGYQGQPFDERVLEKIRSLRKEHPETIISVDGGVNFDTAPHLIEAGANRLVSGSALFESENIIGSIHRLQG